MHSQKAESTGMCFLPQSESSPIITRHRRTAVQYLRDVPTRQRFGQRTGVRRRKYGRSSAPPSGNASTSYSLVDASTRPSVVPFGTPRELFPARRRAGTQVSALHTLPSVSGFHSSVRGSLRYTARTVPGAPPSRNASLRASYAPIGFRLPLIHPRFSSVHRANRSRRAAE